MFKHNRINKIRTFVITMMVVLFFVTSAWATSLLILENKPLTASADIAKVNVTLKDLMTRHGIRYAIGPIKNTTIDGVSYNNEFGITKEFYFNADNFLYTTDNGTVLRGFKPGIKGTYPDQGTINADGSKGSDVGPYIYYPKSDEDESCKYVIIVPDNITTIGTSTNGMSQDGSDYTDFGHFDLNRGLGDDGYYQPRERVGGFYFTNNSELTKIEGGANKKKTNGKVDDGTYSAISSCDNMRFCVLPSNGKLKEIGDYALRGCSQMRDINLPSSLTYLGSGAFFECGMPHLTIPEFSDSNFSRGSDIFSQSTKLRDVKDLSGQFSKNDFPGVMNYYKTETGSKLYAVGTKDGDTGTQAIYFCKNSINSSVFATISGNNKSYSSGWYAVGLAGLEDKGRTTIYDFPATVSANDARRANILYDYLNPDGTGYKNTLSEDIESYDIADLMCNGTWCGNIRIPDTVTVIGDNAFNFSHVQYVEIPKSVTHIGKHAFYDNGRLATNRLGGVQYYYIHGSFVMGSGAFDYSSNYPGSEQGTEARRYVYEDEALYNSFTFTTTSNTTYKITRDYQVPIKAVVESSESDINIVEEEMSTRFKNDSDYVSGAYKTNDNGIYTITYTKRLNGKNFTYVKQENGSWVDKSNDSQALKSKPTVEGMKSTEWFADNTYSAIGSAWGQYASRKPIYTKIIGAPEAKDEEYAYGVDVKEGLAKSFNDALKLSTEYYNVELVKYTDWGNNETLATEITAPKDIINAGHYVVRVNLASKWGTWSDERANEYRYNIEVTQAEIDLGDIDNMPVFTVEGSGAALGGTGEGATLRRYSDGWYLYEKSGVSVLDTKTVLNSFTRYTGNSIGIAADRGSLPYSVSIIRNAGTTSGDYFAEYTLTLPSNYNFKFVSKIQNTNLYNLHGLTFDISNNNQQASINKHWYIVTQGNWLIDSTSTATGDELLNESFTLITIDNVGTTSWNYETAIDVHIPKLAYGKADITFEMFYGINETSITPENEPQPISDINKYINAAMPTGRYTILITAPGVTLDGGISYPEINERIIINVTSRTFDAIKLGAIKTLLNGKTFEHAYNAQVYLPDEAIKSQLQTLNDTLNNERAKTQTAGIWASSEYNAYYGVAAVSYNLDRMQSSEYTENPGMPISVGEYNVYYTVSAPNYKPLVDISLDERRNFGFKVIIFTYISAPNYTDTLSYSGMKNVPLIVSDANYTIIWDEDDEYIDARAKVGDKFETIRHKVTLRSHDSKLYRWDTNSFKDNKNVYLGDEEGDLILEFTIKEAKNNWYLSPRIVQWSWTEYDSQFNVLSAIPYYGANNLEFSIYKNSGELVEFKNGEQTVTSFKFTVNVYGEQVLPDYVTSVLQLLNASNYRLVASVAEDANYEGLNVNNNQNSSYSFEVSKATNTWTETPNVIRWIWGQYNEKTNIISATAKFPITDEDSIFKGDGKEPKVNFTILDGGKNKITGLVDFTVVNSDRAEILKNLPAGTYYLVTSLEGTVNYTDIPESTLQFNIAKATNYWTVTPNVVQWKWSEYDSAVNLITAVAANNTCITGETAPSVKYTVLDSGYNKIDGLVNFVSVGDDEAEILRNLPAGTYYLVTSMEGRNNYSAINPDAVDCDFSDSTQNKTLSNISFEISKVTNIWTATPNVVQWKWSEYNSDINVITAVAANNSYMTGETAPSIYFTILNKEFNIVDAKLVNFTNVSLITSELARLDVGTYYLVTSMDGRNNYTSINDEALGYDFKTLSTNEKLAKSGVEFKVSIIENSWDETEPNMTSWSYGGFSATANFISGAPTFEDKDNKTASVTYQVYKIEENGDVFKYEFTSANSDFISNMSALSVGTYKFVATYPKSNNFKELKKTSTFDVIYVGDNKWSTAPSITGWVYGNFSNTHVTNASDSFNSQFTYAILSNGETKFEDLTFDDLLEILQNMSNLNAGDYELSVEGQPTSNYNVLSTSLEFTIDKADNSWNTYPTIQGWVYGSPNNPVEGKTAQETSLKSEYYSVVINGAEWTLGNKLSGKPEKAGNYAYVTTAAALTNYNVLPYTSFFTISQAPNKWSTPPTDKDWNYGSQAPTITFVPDFGGNTLALYIDGVLTSNLANAIANLGAGTHAVRAEVTETPEYKGLNDSITLNILKADNSWTDNKTLQGTLPSPLIWNWNTIITWSGLQPEFGDTVYVIVTAKGDAVDEDSALYYITIDYAAQDDGYLKAIESVGKALSTLDVGDYNITVTAPSADNWKEWSENKDFTVSKAPNKWLYEPSVTSSATTDGKPSWVYGGAVGKFSATATYGDYLLKYYTLSDSGVRETYGEDGSLMPTNAGNYSVSFRVNGSKNYEGLEERFIDFVIDKKSDKSFVVTPGAVGWVWNTYDREVNLFSGIPSTGGTVTYSVMLNGSVVTVDGQRLENISLVGLDGQFDNDLSTDLYVSEEIGKLLNKLTANTYTLKLSVAATENYLGFDATPSLTVTAAENVWEVTPQVVPWAVYYWTAESTPKAVPRYGVATITINSTFGTRTYYEATYDSATKKTTEITNSLNSAPAGWYVLKAVVPALSGCYNNALGANESDAISFQIFVEGNVQQDNYWKVYPKIADWTANTDGVYSQPEGLPLRGMAIFSFYTAVRGKDNAWSKVDAITEDNGTKVVVTDGAFSYTYYVPVAPGDYIMVAEGLFRDENDNPVVDDVPDAVEVHFEIIWRKNSFTAEPRIDTVLYLGERSEWAQPTAEVAEGRVDFYYRLWGSDDEYTTEMPKEKGIYELKAVGTATYAHDIDQSIKFEVKLSENKWISSPTIQDWSAEVAPNDPVSEALIGNEYIEYLYASADTPDVKFKTKPTQEGTYIVYATLELEGYETLTHQWTFQITPAFDRQLLTIDIVLGIVACLAAGVVIYFAVRRYKENG